MTVLYIGQIKIKRKKGGADNQMDIFGRNPYYGIENIKAYDYIPS